MSKVIVIKLKKVGSRLNTFTIKDNYGNTLLTGVSKESLITGKTVTINDNVTVILIQSEDCCDKIWRFPVTTTTIYELSTITAQSENTPTLWSHLTDITLYNSFYGCIHPYILEYPISYQYYDEIIQNIKDYSKVYKYLPNQVGAYDVNAKIQTDRDYFNKAVIYNDQQSSGVLELVPKPKNNLQGYFSYPAYNTDSKTIVFTKSDNFYQFNTFWSIVKDETNPLFTTPCSSLSLDKEVNQSNMDYDRRTFQKYKMRAKDAKIRMILDDRSDIKIVSQIIYGPSQISYK